MRGLASDFDEGSVRVCHWIQAIFDKLDDARYVSFFFGTGDGFSEGIVWRKVGVAVGGLLLWRGFPAGDAGVEIFPAEVVE